MESEKELHLTPPAIPDWKGKSRGDSASMPDSNKNQTDAPQTQNVSNYPHKAPSQVAYL